MFVLVGADEGFLTKGFGGKNNSVWWGWVLVHEGDLGGKKHEREQTFRPAQSVSADTLAVKTSSWFVIPERGESTGRPL